MPRKNRSRGQLSLKPPQISSDPEIHHTYRFVSTSALSGVLITAADVIGAMGVFTSTTNVSVVSIFSAFKISKIRIWGSVPVTTTGAVSTVSLDWTNNASVSALLSSLEYSDTSNNPAAPPFLDLTPPRDAYAGMWMEATSQALFSISCPINSIIDVTLRGVMSDNQSAQSYNVATAALGFEYFLALDGFASNLLVPVSLTTTH
jgi:hypothetical protein